MESSIKLVIHVMIVKHVCADMRSSVPKAPDGPFGTTTHHRSGDILLHVILSSLLYCTVLYKLRRD